MPSFVSKCWLASTGFLLFISLTGAVSVPDTLEQRLAACSACHGERGMGDASRPEIPRLAGKPAGYLYKQMHSIKSQQGQNQAMEYVMRQLSPSYMHKIAQYYEQQVIPYQASKLPADITPAMLVRGKELVEKGDEARGVPACMDCHGQALTGVKPMIPGLLNQPYAYLSTQLSLWRNNARSVESTHCMWVVAKRMKNSDVPAVSAYLASLPLPEQVQPIELSALPNQLPGWCVLEDGEGK